MTFHRHSRESGNLGPHDAVSGIPASAGVTVKALTGGGL